MITLTLAALSLVAPTSAEAATAPPAPACFQQDTDPEYEKKIADAGNDVAKLWAAYKDSHERITYYVPVLDTSLSLGVERAANVESSETPARRVDPSLVFKALGDTTRYAMATTLARTPMTSVELAKIFKVSKPTISHHVAHLRAANLLTERQTDHGNVLSLDRRVLEKASAVAAGDMFSEEGPDHVIKRSRRSKQ
jgi:DNA-binding transcriptional ArsR family regulator